MILRSADPTAPLRFCHLAMCALAKNNRTCIINNFSHKLNPQIFEKSLTSQNMISCQSAQTLLFFSGKIWVCTQARWKAEYTLASRMQIHESLTVLALLTRGEARTSDPWICSLMFYHLSHLTTYIHTYIHTLFV